MEYTFNFRQSATGNITAYFGSETLYDDSSPEYIALDCGNDLIDKFKEYYEQGFQREIPRPRLFAINCQDVNAFAVYEESLNAYCIGINLGAFQRIREKTEEIVDIVIERSLNEPEESQLIPQNEREKWIDLVYINAMRFFVAHEYSHILNGHVDKNDEGHFEFADEVLPVSDNLFQQMKEFDADETAMNQRNQNRAEVVKYPPGFSFWLERRESNALQTESSLQAARVCCPGGARQAVL